MNIAVNSGDIHNRIKEIQLVLWTGRLIFFEKSKKKLNDLLFDKHLP